MNIEGYEKIDSGVGGPVLAVTGFTHGNEVCGKYVIDFLRKNLKLRKGSVIFGFNNLEASRQGKRFVDINFNRLPENIMELRKDPRYEIRRFFEILPVFEMADFVIDLHSTTQKSKPMIVGIGDRYEELASFVPIEILISNIDKVQVGRPLCSFFGKIPIIEIETGSHNDIYGYKLALASVLNVFRKLKMIDGACDDFFRVARKEYRVLDSLLFLDLSCELVREFRMFEYVKEGELLAKDFRMPFDGTILMPPKGKTVDSIDEEVLFIAKSLSS